ncbi:hypothetical protein K469DRAFT_747683 [Zopfia rhizophila CBS 207.26]|uniref:Uncharacterized protein n=1 Tax=Zopfia rhizophila CBS 207.26 TaxID=1314779 RepID=A0A6A6ECD2_9PEZI|nr:hypothetical protein K469DRAFT_747683 [Zopfia rhizophila CBS 207.26]
MQVEQLNDSSSSSGSSAPTAKPSGLVTSRLAITLSPTALEFHPAAAHTKIDTALGEKQIYTAPEAIGPTKVTSTSELFNRVDMSTPSTSVLQQRSPQSFGDASDDYETAYTHLSKSSNEDEEAPVSEKSSVNNEVSPPSALFARHSCLSLDTQGKRLGRPTQYVLGIGPAIPVAKKPSISRMSSCPPIPSKLRSGDFTDDLGSEISGLIPSPTSIRTRSSRYPSTSRIEPPFGVIGSGRPSRNLSIDGGRMQAYTLTQIPTNSSLDSLSVPGDGGSPRKSRLDGAFKRPGLGIPDTHVPSEFSTYNQSARSNRVRAYQDDFHNKSAYAYDAGSILMPPAAPGIYFREPTDPFVDSDVYLNFSPGHMARRAEAARAVGPSSALDFQAFLAAQLSDNRVDLPIPPLSLPIAADLPVKHTKAARQKLGGQKVKREQWIREEAKRISDLAKAKFATEQRYYQTLSQEDHQAWRAATEAFNQATSRDYQQEVRRNMFSPEGIRTMRTGPYNIPTDGYRGVQLAGTSGGGGVEGDSSGQGRLLGFQMALMEQYCTEIEDDER